MFSSLAEAPEGQQHAVSRTRVHAHTTTLHLVLNQKCISPNVQCSSSSYHSSSSLNLPASLPLAQDLGRSISDESIHRVLSDNLILENMTHQSARRDHHHQRVDGGASHAYLWGYWRVYSGRPRTLLLPICLSVCLSGGARSSVFLQKLEKTKLPKAQADIHTPKFLTKVEGND